MNRKIVLKHGIAIVAICFFGVLALGSTSSTPKAVTSSVISGSQEETVISSVTKSRGVVHNVPDPNQKSFTSLGVVFATSVTKFDEKGLETSSEEGIVTLLMREAKKVGADDILNLRVDENITWVESTITGTGSTATKTVIKTKTITITGSALAIKYQDR
jgi:hypothetical protein